MHHLCERTSHADGQAFLAPLPVESFLGSAQGDDDVDVVAALHALQVALHQVAGLGMVFHEVGHFQEPSVPGSHIVDAAVVVVAALHRAYHLDDFIHLGIFAQSGMGTGVDAGDVDDGLLRGVEYLGDVVEVTAVVEVVAQHEVLEIAVAVELLVVVVGDGMEARLVFGSQYGDAVATEVAAGHCHDVSRGVVHHAAHDVAQSAVCVGTGMVELVYCQEAVVELLVAYFLHAVAQGGMGADQNLCLVLLEELYKPLRLVALVAGIAEIEVWGYSPVGKEAVLHQVGVLEGPADAFLGYCHHHFLDALVHELVEGDEHQGSALAGGWRSLDQQEAFVASLVGLGLHLSHAEGVGVARSTGLLVLDVNDVVV